MPSETATSCPARAMSSTVSTGNVSRYGWPVAGLIDAGEVEPNGLPSELMQMTKKRRVSIGRPGPIMSSHQPWRRILGRRSRMRRGRQAGEDQDGVVVAERRVAPGLVGDLDARQRAAAAHLERLLELQYFSGSGHGASQFESLSRTSLSVPLEMATFLSSRLHA